MCSSSAHTEILAKSTRARRFGGGGKAGAGGGGGGGGVRLSAACIQREYTKFKTTTRIAKNFASSNTRAHGMVWAPLDPESNSAPVSLSRLGAKEFLCWVIP